RSRIVLYLLILGPISLANTFSFFYAYKNTTIANAVLTHYTAPIIVAFLAPIFLKERLTGRVLTAVAVATAGLWIMLDVSVSSFISLILAGDRNTGGILSGLFSGFAYAILIIIFRVFAQNFNPLVMTFFQNFVIAALLAPFVEMPRTFVSELWVFAVMGIVHSTIAPVLYFKGMKQVTSNRAAILGYLEPVCAILLGVIFLGETVNYKTVIGGVMILFSGYLTIKGQD
ncbi:MAG: EamA family transporter, partial [Nitrospirae bacterium]|nr:EamA family transporter [Nitrospirota bacterium]